MPADGPDEAAAAGGKTEGEKEVGAGEKQQGQSDLRDVECKKRRMEEALLVCRPEIVAVCTGMHARQMGEKPIACSADPVPVGIGQMLCGDALCGRRPMAMPRDVSTVLRRSL
ncbi:hypothetical protein NN6n1_01250 [Shinella zoogloeoides]